MSIRTTTTLNTYGNAIPKFWVKRYAEEDFGWVRLKICCVVKFSAEIFYGGRRGIFLLDRDFSFNVLHYVEYIRSPSATFFVSNLNQGFTPLWIFMAIVNHLLYEKPNIQTTQFLIHYLFMVWFWASLLLSCARQSKILRGIMAWSHPIFCPFLNHSNLLFLAHLSFV